MAVVLCLVAQQVLAGTPAASRPLSGNRYDLVFSTYFGGSGGELLRDMTADSRGNIHVAGIAGAADFPRTPPAIGGQSRGGGGMVAKFSPAGKLIWSKVVGGLGKSSYLYSAKVDTAGGVIVAGRMPPGFPTTPGAFQTTSGGGPEDFGIARFSPTGKLLAATYLGGNGDETNGPDQIVVDSRGNIVVAGSSSSTDFPVTPTALAAKNAGAGGKYPFDGIVSVLSNDLSRLVYSSYVGGTGDDMARACCVGSDGTLYVGGVTTSRDFPVKNAWQSKYGGDPGFGSAPNGGRFPVGWGNGDCWVLKLQPPPIPHGAAAK
jgi:hypothetical protein